MRKSSRRELKVESLESIKLLSTLMPTARPHGLAVIHGSGMTHNVKAWNGDPVVHGDHMAHLGKSDKVHAMVVPADSKAIAMVKPS